MTRPKSEADWQAEVDDLRRKIAIDEENQDDWLNDLMKMASDDFDGDESMEALATRYVRHLEAENARLHGAEQVIAAGLVAFQLTREYVGEDVLPALDGWSHHEWTKRAEAFLADGTTKADRFDFSDNGSMNSADWDLADGTTKADPPIWREPFDRGTGRVTLRADTTEANRPRRRSLFEVMFHQPPRGDDKTEADP